MMPAASRQDSLSSSSSGGNAALAAWLRALELTAPIATKPERIFPAVIDELAAKFETNPALLDDNSCLSFRDLSERMNRYACWAHGQSLGEGDVVCLLMSNCADYLAIWLGITKVGAVVALINTNLEGASLAHAINIAAPKHIIVAADHAGTFTPVLPAVVNEVRCWSHSGAISNFPRLDTLIENYDGARIDSIEYSPPSLTSRALLIYTSGTTGLPKAANVSHRRIMQWSHWFAGMLDTGPTDRMYNCLPMYHSVGGIVAVGATLLGGGSVLLRPRFSASRFWDEITDWDCTLFQYIGELCRFLVNSPVHPLETSHRLRLCCGNGLRPDVWEAFKQRFDIPRILEFYAATEANFSLYNCEGEPGSIGRIPSFLNQRAGVKLVRFDVEAGAPFRDSRGYCVACSPNETGEAIGKIEGSGAAGRFEGYADADATERKILRNVFIDGDAWFRTGDLMRKDERGFFYFVDRVGDTFRWKGENVSSQEVAEVIAACPGVVEAVVYGVNVRGHDGRAGMAAIVAETSFAPDVLRRHLADHLPAYAHPLFLRLCAAVDMTSTFRPRKQDLMRDGYDPDASADTVFFKKTGGNGFEKMNAGVYAQIVAGQLRV